ncbi:hypothetical protein ACROYT_G021677 [Oculina patagonica]
MAAVRRWLESRNVLTQSDWLEACINFVKEDNEERQLSAVQLNELVYEQWLMAEIQESSLPCLPDGLENREMCKLEGHFNLQINSILNVGESAYSQIQKLKGQDDPQELNYKANPSEPKIKPSRMLLLELTDGTQTVFGMEYQLIPFLKVATPPGTKIQVSGQITCRLGALLLTPSNVKVLGGNIVHLMEGNSYWNILHQAIGQDPPEKPSVIKTESLSSEEPNANQIIIQDDATSSITTYNNQRAPVKTDTNRRNIAAGLSNNNPIGNAGNYSENRGQLKQQGPKRNKGVKGVFPANSSRDFNSYGTNSTMEKVCKQEFFDDDDDNILAAVADDDYFMLEEDFDMEEIEQLEIGMQNTKSTTDKKSTTSNVIASGNNLEMPSYDDEIFEDDFEAEDLLAEAADSLEIKPLHERICSKGTMGTMHGSKKAKISNSSSMEFSSHLRNITNSSNNANIQKPSDVNSRKARDTRSALDSVGTEPISLMNNATFNSCSVFINTGPCCKSKNTGGLKLSSKKTNVVTNSSLSSTRRKFSEDSSIRKEPENEVVSGCMNNTVTPMVVDTNQHQSTVMRNIHEKQDQECNSAPFEYLTDVLKYCPVSEKRIVRVKAYIATLLSGPQPMVSKWNITVKLNDGTATVDADLSEKVLTELLEYPVDKYQLEIQEAMRSRNLALCQKLHKRTGQFQRNLASTSGLMDLQFSPDTPRPRVLRLTQPTSRDVSEMIRRVNERF